MKQDQIEDFCLRNLMQFLPKKSIKKILEDTLSSAESEGHFRQMATAALENIQQEVSLINIYLKDEKQ
ncbi:MAG: hypothetical protein ABRQ37_16810 [Candidatus Eremiobacterota bacterium]|jgi:hypothetical protein